MITNEQRSQQEIEEFMRDKPDRYFAYVKQEIESGYRTGQVTVTTWMGDVLGTAHLGFRYRSNMGDTRIPIRVKGINGVNYYGTYFYGAGDYCRLKAYKGGSR